jgi:chloramphenicol 3-O phosphotransferase
MGPFAEKMSQTLKEIVLTLAKMGHHIIIDDVAFGKADVDVWRESLKEYKVLWIGLKTSLQELEEREKGRDNRIQGSARAQYFKAHNGVTYDLEFDTGKENL